MFWTPARRLPTAFFLLRAQPCATKAGLGVCHAAPRPQPHPHPPASHIHIHTHPRPRRPEIAPARLQKEKARHRRLGRRLFSQPHPLHHSTRNPFATILRARRSVRSPGHHHHETRPGLLHPSKHAVRPASQCCLGSSRQFVSFRLASASTSSQCHIGPAQNKGAHEGVHVNVCRPRSVTYDEAQTNISATALALPPAVDPAAAASDRLRHGRRAAGSAISMRYVCGAVTKHHGQTSSCIPLGPNTRALGPCVGRLSCQMVHGAEVCIAGCSLEMPTEH